MIKDKNITGWSQRSFFMILTIVMLASACDDRWEEMNTDPNQIVDLPDGYLFTSAIRGTFLDDLNRIEADFGGQYAHMITSDVFNREIDKYNDIHSQGDVQEEIFRGVYNGALRNIREVLTLTNEGKYKNEVRHAQATVINVVNIAKLTDLFGDVPFVEAAQGKDENYTPQYDAQKDIYSGMINLLTESLTLLNNATSDQTYSQKFDPLYYGDLTAWKRFANSMRLRLAMRARFVDPIKYNPIIADCLTAPLIEANEDNAKLENWESENPLLYNPWYNKIIDYSANRFTILWSDMFINTLQSNNDPRLPFFATKNKNGIFLGMPNGLLDIPYSQWSKVNTSRFTPEFVAKDQPLYLMTAGEIWLLRAEAALFTIGQPADANMLYQAGIAKAMEQWNIPADQISQYLTTEASATLSGSTDNMFSQIATQLWIGFAPNFVESWHTIKRTGYPIIAQRTDPNYSKGVTDGFLPKRLKYPFTVEKITNGVNIQSAIDRMGGMDKIDIPVWWDN
jgi:hypothetical protein